MKYALTHLGLIESTTERLTPIWSGASGPLRRAACSRAATLVPHLRDANVIFSDLA